MALTRDFKDTAKKRAEHDPDFAKALLHESIDLLLNGDTVAAKLILRDLINATVGFERLAEEVHRPSKSLHRMLSASGNPTMENLSIIFSMLRKTLQVNDSHMLLLHDPSAPKREYKLGSNISAVFGIEQKKRTPLPLFSCGVSAGFPSPADDYIGQQLDFNQLLIKNPAATFCVRVAGDSMTGAGINDHDILVVDRSLEPTNGKIIIAALNGELTVKRLARSERSCTLVAENPNYPALEITEELSCIVWGVVTSVIHQFP